MEYLPWPCQFRQSGHFGRDEPLQKAYRDITPIVTSLAGKHEIQRLDQLILREQTCVLAGLLIPDFVSRTLRI